MSNPPRRNLGGEQVEGRRAVLELLRAARRRTRDVWMADGLDDADILREIADRARDAGVRVQRVSRGRLERIGVGQHPLGRGRARLRVEATELDRLCQTGDVPFLVAVDGVTDPQNLGALLRSAEGAGVTGVVVPRHRAVHVTAAVTKAAAGAVEYLPMAVVPGIPAALARARELGVWVVGLDADGEESLFGLTLATEPLVLVLGAEGSGLSRLTRRRCDVVARVPLAGRVASLNVAAAGALALFEVNRGRHAQQQEARPTRRSKR
jgi:23S rRNA (guanosine2251-2'-O)-methyltransferase